MSDADFCFDAHWHLAARRQRIWEVVVDVETWPRWWPGLVAAEPLPGPALDGHPFGWRFAWRGRLPYTLHIFIHVTCWDVGNCLAGEVSGTLIGTCCWYFETLEDDSTDVRFEWCVSGMQPLSGLFAPLLRTAFRLNFESLMANGCDGLRNYLSQSADRT